MLLLIGHGELAYGPIASNRAARALLRWTVDDLAREAALGRNKILRAELAENR